MNIRKWVYCSNGQFYKLLILSALRVAKTRQLPTSQFLPLSIWIMGLQNGYSLRYITGNDTTYGKQAPNCMIFIVNIQKWLLEYEGCIFWALPPADSVGSWRQRLLLLAIFPVIDIDNGASEWVQFEIYYMRCHYIRKTSTKLYDYLMNHDLELLL